MYILAFESSCDETSASVVLKDEAGFTVKSNIVASQIETHRLYGGVVPEIASRAHVEAISGITRAALREAEVSLSDIGLVAVTANPGLIGALLVGVNYAKAVAAANGIPLVAVDHIKGHIAAAYLLPEAPKPPFLALTASGGHTSIYRVNDYTDIETLGQTRDDAIGESFDKIGRIIGIPYPAGRGFDGLARLGFERAVGMSIDTEGFYEKYRKCPEYKENRMPLPSPALSDGTLDFSFSGLKTAAINLLHKYEMRGEEIDRELFAARYTYEAAGAIGKKMVMALEQNPGLDLVISGGVAANTHLRRILHDVAKKKKVKIYIPDMSLCGDNAAMIAAAGYYEYEGGARSDSTLNASARDSL